MSQASEQIAKQFAAAAINKKNWGAVAYNVLVEGLVGDGVTDDTAKLQALIDLAISEGRKAIFFPHTPTGGKYYVTSLTGANQVVFFGDNASFVGGYGGFIFQMGDWITPVQLEQKASKAYVDSQDSLKADRVYVDSLVANVASGSPKGTYATLAALQAAYPTGANGIYVVTANGNWYYWSGISWTVGGMYQSTGLSDDSVDYNILSKTLINPSATYKVYYKNATDELLIDFVFDMSAAISGGLINTGSPISLKYDLYTDDPNVVQTGWRLFINNSNVGGDPLGGDITYGTSSEPYTSAKIGGFTQYSATKGNLPTTSYNFAHAMIVVKLTDKSQFALTYINNINFSVGSVGFNVGNIGLFNSEPGSYILEQEYFNKMLATREYVDNKVNDSSKWSNKTWMCIGDSITEHNFRSNKNYQDYIAEQIGCTVINKGISGTGYKDRYDLVGITEDADLITVFLGVNDFMGIGGLQLPLGVFGDTGITTLCGRIYNLLNNLVNKYPTKRLAVFTPLSYIGNYGNNASPNAEGYTLKQLSDAIITHANHFAIPYLDLYSVSNLNVQNSVANSYYFTAPTETLPDGLHPNDNGHKVMADKILAFINLL